MSPFFAPLHSCLRFVIPRLYSVARLGFACFCALILAACAGDQTPKTNILDAAAIYEANADVFADLRTRYPGPFEGFTRLPDRDPAKVTPQMENYLAALRQRIPLEYIDFFPLGNSGKDEIDVILHRYGMDTDWTVVSLVYSGIPLPPAEDGKGIRIFDRCDGRSMEWLQAARDTDAVAAFCRLDEFWYAYQRIE